MANGWSFFDRFLPAQLYAVLASHTPLRIRIFYGSTLGTTREAALRTAKHLSAKVSDVTVTDLSGYDADELASETVVLFFIATAAEGAPPASAAHFCALVREHTRDFRVGPTWLHGVRFAVVGFGSDEYAAEHYCTAAAHLDADLGALGASRLLPLAKVTDTRSVDAQVGTWLMHLDTVVLKLRFKGPEVPQGADTVDDRDASDDESAQDESGGGAAGGDDLEDTDPISAQVMVTARQKGQLEKEGYHLVGGHSAVKLCRWTKHHLRGQGGCYKHTFYGITSYQCMEATPSLACANKCTFCWRHHKNPVGTKWKWKQDPPKMIVDGAIDEHVRMIRTLKGVPGVQTERFADALTVRHCALSLVGEPIMYPRINELLGLLHERRISTFMVTNAQFPKEIENLTPVTQLYVSIDASTKEELKAIDRPLFLDYWERFQACLVALKKKQQRTVYRLTLVKAFNMSEAKEYADLVLRGTPDLIEIKAVTFCGSSKASTLSMQNVPWHDEVRAYALAILAANPKVSEMYGFACEHRHSTCVLLAHKKFFVDGQWHTWIDYDRFHDLVSSGKPFTSLDYMAPTPAWAVPGAVEEGFDPADTRVRKHGAYSKARLAKSNKQI
jgi:tRNA wybutosine-synthesizing protein 1